MKTSFFFMCLFAITLVGYAQNKSIITKKQNSNIGFNKILNRPNSNNKLSWYFNSQKNIYNRVKKNGSTETNSILAEKSQGGIKSVMGVKLKTKSDEVITPNGSSVTKPSGNLTCTYQPMSLDILNQGNFSLLRADATNTKIYPGAIYKADEVLNNTFGYSAQNPRAPLSIGIDLFANGNSVTEYKVEDWSTNPEVKIRQKLVTSNYGAGIPSSFIYELTDINSTIELKASLEAYAGLFLPLEELGIPLNITEGINADINATGKVTERTYMFSLYQPYYTLSVLNQNPSSFYVDSQENLRKTKDVMINSVTYGRRITAFFKSKTTEAEIRGALEVGLGLEFMEGGLSGLKAGYNGSAEATARFNKVITNFKAIVYGGSANKVMTDPKQLQTYLNEPNSMTLTNGSGEKPIAFSMTRVSDNGLVGVLSTGNFEQIMSCNEDTYNVKVVFGGIKAFAVDDYGDNLELFGNLSIKEAKIEGKDIPGSLSEIWACSEKNSIVLKKDGEWGIGGTSKPQFEVYKNLTKADLYNVVLKMGVKLIENDAALTGTNDAFTLVHPNELNVILRNHSEIENLKKGQEMLLKEGDNNSFEITMKEGKNKVNFYYEVKIGRN